MKKTLYLTLCFFLYFLPKNTDAQCPTPAGAVVTFSISEDTICKNDTIHMTFSTKYTGGFL
jgi:hypothetical protein